MISKRMLPAPFGKKALIILLLTLYMCRTVLSIAMENGRILSGVTTKPTGQPSRQPTQQPTSNPTMVPYHYVHVIDTSDRPLVSNVDYRCQQNSLPSANNNSRPCTFRSAFYYCMSLDPYRNSLSQTTCIIKMPPPTGLGIGRNIFKLWPESIIYSPSMISRNVHIIIDGNGWTFTPSVIEAGNWRFYLGSKYWTTYPFLVTTPTLTKITFKYGEEENARRRLFEETAEVDRYPGGAPDEATDRTAEDYANEVDEALRGERFSASVVGGEPVITDELSPTVIGKSVSVNLAEDNSMVSYRSPLQGDGSLHHRRLLVYSPIAQENTKTYSLEIWNLTFSGFGAISPLISKATGDSYDAFSGSCMDITNLGRFVLRGVTFVNNTGIVGGALFFNSTDNIVMDRVSFVSNTGRQMGGGFYAINARAIDISSSNFSKNFAGMFQGGGFFIDTAGSVSVRSSRFHRNAAASYLPTGYGNFYRLGGWGGGAAFNRVYNLSVTSSTFSKNEARFGGAVIIGGEGVGAILTVNSSRVTSRIAGNAFISNKAMIAGGGVYWISVTVMLPPSGLRHNTYDGNQAVYGPDKATEATTLKPSPPKLYVSRYVPATPEEDPSGQGGIPSILESQAYLQDFYSQQVLSDENSYGQISIEDKTPEGDPKLQLGCGTQLDFVSVTGATDAYSTRGQLEWSKWGGSCLPGGVMNATYKISTSTFSSRYPEYAMTLKFSPTARNGFFSTIRPIMADVQVYYRACRKGEYYNFFTDKKDSCIECAGSYQWYDNKDNLYTGCVKCPKLAKECYSDQIIVHPGTWRWQHLATTILKCPFGANGCKGGNFTGKAACNIGYHGPVCGICDLNYFTKSKQCLPCSDQAFMSTNTIIIMVVFSVTLTLSLMLEVRRWARRNEAHPIEYFKRFFKVEVKVVTDEEHETAYDRAEKGKMRAWMVRIKILVATYQIIMAVPTTFDIDMGPLFQAMMDMMSFLNFDLLQIFPMQCVQPFAYIENMISSTLSPILVVVVIVVFYVVQRLHIMAAERNRIKRREKMKKLLIRYFTIFVSFFYMILPGISMKIFKTFQCQDIDPLRESPDPSAPHVFLQSDYAVDCTTEYYNFGYKWALLMVIVYPFGVTFFNFCLVYFNRKEIKSRAEKMAYMRSLDEMCEATPEEMEEYVKNAEKKRKNKDKIINTAFVEGIQFLWSSYRSDVWYWEVIETTRRLGCSSVMSIVAAGTPTQCCFAVLVSVAYVKLYSGAQPYFDPFDNVMAEFGLYQVFFTFFSVYVLRQRSIGENESVYYFLDSLTVLVNFLVLGSFLYTVLGELLAHRARLRRIRMGLPPEEIVQTYRPPPRTAEMDMELILSAMRRNPKVLDQMGLAMEKKGDRFTEKRRGIEMSVTSLEGLLMQRAKRREGVKMSMEEFQAMMAKNAKKRDSIKAFNPNDLKELQDYQPSSSSSGSSSSSSSSNSNSNSDSNSNSNSSSSSSSSSNSNSNSNSSRSSSSSSSKHDRGNAKKHSLSSSSSSSSAGKNAKSRHTKNSSSDSSSSGPARISFNAPKYSSSSSGGSKSGSSSGSGSGSRSGSGSGNSRSGSGSGSSRSGSGSDGHSTNSHVSFTGDYDAALRVSLEHVEAAQKLRKRSTMDEEIDNLMKSMSSGRMFGDKQNGTMAAEPTEDSKANTAPTKNSDKSFSISGMFSAAAKRFAAGSSEPQSSIAAGGQRSVSPGGLFSAAKRIAARNGAQSATGTMPATDESVAPTGLFAMAGGSFAIRRPGGLPIRANSRLSVSDTSNTRRGLEPREALALDVKSDSSEDEM